MIAKVHRHWLFIAVRIVVVLILISLPVIVVPLLERLGVIAVSTLSVPTLMTLWALWGLMAWTIFWQFWTTYYMDIWVVTNKRIIDIDYERLFDRSIHVLELTKVQDISTRVQGILGTLFKYGSVIVQTAGTQDQFIIDQIADPEHLRDVISEAMGAQERQPQKVEIVP